VGFVARLWAVVAVFGAVALWRSHELGIPLRDVHGEILRVRLLISAVVFVAISLIWAWWRSEPRRLRSVPAVWREQWTARRLVLAAVALLAYHATYFAYHNLKSWDVFNAPRDADLTRWDEWLFLGHSPAVLLHDLLGTGAAFWVLMVLYEAFPTIVTVAFPASVVLCRRIRDGYYWIASFVWVWILGTITYYAIPSLGPFRESPEDFADLPDFKVKHTQALYLAQREHLLAHPSAADAFAQVSAFASLHVGVSTVIWLMLGRMGQRLWFRVFGAYVFLTCVATVYLGWHFFLDDVAGLAIGWLACVLGRLTIYPRGFPGSDDADRDRSREVPARS
jgi:membrane-associated phospholipid phosphatase